MPVDGNPVHQHSDCKVSVIIPVYNVEKFLRKCLDSVVNQTLRDIEIICVNDCSPDNSQEILNEYACKDSRLVLLNHEQNKGLAGTRNTGLAVAKGDYIYFIDSDDFLACDDALESLYSTAIADDADEVIGGVLKWYEDTGEKLLDWHEHYLKKDVRGKPLIKLPQLWSNVVAWNKMIRRSFLKEHNICFNEKIRKHEDNPFSIQVHILARKISILTRTTYIYRQVHSGSIMSTEKKTDAYQRCFYCHDIFKFIEADEKRHIFRKMYYPLYSRQLIGSAAILSRYSPSDEEISELLSHWKRIVNLIPHDFPKIPIRKHQVLKHIRNGENKKAWEKALELFHVIKPQDRDPELTGDISPGLRVNEHLGNREQIQQEIEKQRKLKELLSLQIEAVYKSYSWRITLPLRWIHGKLTSIL